MIVKNEAHVIEPTLENITSHVKLSYWTISDTGSSDTTREKIIHFFKKKNIPGELINHPWKDFAHNRTKALECAYNKTDYIMLFDADDSIIGKLELPVMTEDIYMAAFDPIVSYVRPLFITNRKKWHYTGVLHEYLDATDDRTRVIIKGNYYIMSGRTGNRNKNPNKYLDDAAILVKAYHSETNSSLKNRYAYYSAQSFLDAKLYNKALEWYKICLSQSTWNQERYCSCIEIGKIYASYRKMNEAIHYWKKSIECDRERIDGVIYLMQYFYKYKNYYIVNKLYHAFKNYSYHPQKLFINKAFYYYELEYFNALSAHHVNDKSGQDCCKKIIAYHKNAKYVDTCTQELKYYDKL